MSETPASPNEAAHAVSDSESKTILVVDDEAKMRQLIRMSLARRGFAVLEAADGEEAVRLCREHQGPIHLVLLDVVMPGMSGLELAPRILELRPGVQMILMSGHVDDQVLLHGSLNPNTPFFHKPFTLEALVDKIRDMLESAP
jgi:DNA-binding NtrC family response regulator